MIDAYSQLGIPDWLIVVSLIWILIWKGLALWKSAKRNSKIWFVLILIVNTLGILEILYYFLFSEIKMEQPKKSSRNRKKTRKKTARKKK